METTTQEIVNIKEAEFINFLVDMKFIDKKRISDADIITIGELIKRNPAEIVNFQHTEDSIFIPEEKLNKIKKLLGSRSGQNITEIEKTRQTAKDVLEKLKISSKFPISGMIVFGSRMDSLKNPTSNSDLDMCLFVNSSALISLPTDDFFKNLDSYKNQVNNMGLPFEVTLNDIYDPTTFSIVIDEKNEQVEVPFWGWNPNAVEVVGSIFIDGREYKDEEATNYVRKKLASSEMNLKRDKAVSKVEEKIISLTGPLFVDPDLDSYLYIQIVRYSSEEIF